MYRMLLINTLNLFTIKNIDADERTTTKNIQLNSKTE